MSVYVLGYTTVELDPKEWPPENKRVTYSPISAKIRIRAAVFDFGLAR